MSTGMILAIVFLFFILGLVLATGRNSAMCFDEEEETITTTTTEQRLNVVGNLRRQAEGVQSFVIDPVDQQKIWLNSNDDMYEDAAGKIWRLV